MGQLLVRRHGVLWVVLAQNADPMGDMCFQAIWDMGGPYSSSDNFFYLAVFEISELVANIG